MKAIYYFRMVFAVIFVASVFSSVNAGPKPAQPGASKASPHRRGIDLKLAIAKTATATQVTIQNIGYGWKSTTESGAMFSGILVARSSTKINESKQNPEKENYRCRCQDFTEAVPSTGYTVTKQYNDGDFKNLIYGEGTFYYAARISLNPPNHPKYREPQKNNVDFIESWNPGYNCHQTESPGCQNLTTFFPIPSSHQYKIDNYNKSLVK